MKQRIRKKQWNNLKAKTKRVFYKGIGTEFYLTVKDYEDDWYWNPPNIGQMIEFLGEDEQHFNKAWWNRLFRADEAYGDYIIEKNYEGELCDALWEAVKYKLNN